MIWDTSIWRLGCSNHSKIRSAQKCYPCLRYVVSPMCQGWTFEKVARPGRLELPTLCLEARASPIILCCPALITFTLFNDLAYSAPTRVKPVKGSFTRFYLRKGKRE